MTKKKKSKKGKIEVGFHQGHVIMYLAEHYDTCHAVLAELTQNLIDANARNALILVDLTELSLTAYDNGAGESAQKMKERVQNIGRRMKKAGKIGQKGIGNLASLSLVSPKSVWSMVTHKAKGRTASNRWFEMKFDARQLSNEKVTFDQNPVSADYLKSDKEAAGIPGLATRIHVTNIEKTALEELISSKNPAKDICQRLANKYSRDIENKKMDIKVLVKRVDGSSIKRKVEPQRFPGEKTVHTIATESGHKVVFEMYWTQKRRHEASRVSIQHNNGIRFALTRMRKVSVIFKDVFASGHVQGIIHVNGFCTLNAQRSAFKYDADLDEFQEAMLSYYYDVAEPKLNEIQKAQRQSTTMRIISDVVEKIGEFLLENDALRSSSVLAGKGNPGRPTSDGDTGYTPATSEKRKRKSESVEHKSRKTKRKKSVIRPHQELHTVSHSVGIVVRLVEADPSDLLGLAWRSQLGDDKLRGAIIINCSHPDWLATEKAGNAAIHTHACLLIMKELTIALESSETRGAAFNQVFDNQFLSFRELLYPRIPRGSTTKAK